MDPNDQLLMAARGHHGLPPTATMGGMEGAGPDEEPASDREVASTAAQHLLECIQKAQDPDLNKALSVALAALHKYIAQDQKEHHDALGGKLSPRLMARAHGRTA